MIFDPSANLSGKFFMTMPLQKMLVLKVHLPCSAKFGGKRIENRRSWD